MGSVLSGEADKVSLTKARRLCENAGRSWDDAWSAMFFAARTDLLEALRAEEIAALAPAPAAAEDVDVADAGDAPEADRTRPRSGGGEEADAWKTTATTARPTTTTRPTATADGRPAADRDDRFAAEMKLLAAIEAVGGEGVAKGKDREKRGSFAKLHKVRDTLRILRAWLPKQRLRAAWALEGGASAYGDATSVRFAVGQRLRLSVDADDAEGSVHGVRVVGTAGDSRDVDLTKSVWKCDAAPTPLPRSLGTPGSWDAAVAAVGGTRFPYALEFGPSATNPRSTYPGRPPSPHDVAIRATLGWPLAPAAAGAYFTLAGISRKQISDARHRLVAPSADRGFYLLVRDVDGRRVAVGEVRAGAAYKDARFYNTKAVLRSSDWLEDLSIAYAAKKRQPARKEQAPKGLEQHLKQLLASTFPAVDDADVRSVAATARVRAPPQTLACALGHRLRLRPGKHAWGAGSIGASGTVVGLDTRSGLYAFRVDNHGLRGGVPESSEAARSLCSGALGPEAFLLNPVLQRNATPAPSHAYVPGQRLLVLDPATRLREDALVVSAAGGGRPAVVRFEDRDEDEPVDLNAFNHSVARMSRAHLVSALREYARAVALENEFVEDAITGKHLHALRQTLHIGLAERDGVGGVAAERYGDARRSSDLVALLTEPQQGDGSAGEAAAQPVLIMAEAGTGKSWMTKQIACAAAKAVQTGDPAGQFYPLVIYAFIRIKFGDQPATCAALLQCFQQRTLCVIVDGIDEAADLKALIENFIFREIVPLGHRLLVTSRPEAIDAKRYAPSFVLLSLRKLDAEAQALAIRQQVEDNEYFQRLAAFAEVRLRHDALWGHVPEDQQGAKSWRAATPSSCAKAAHDEREGYEGYYDDGGLATANVVDVLRATLLFDDAPNRRDPAPPPAIASWDKESRAHEREYFRRELSGVGLGSNLEDFLDKTMSVYASICETPVRLSLLILVLEGAATREMPTSVGDLYRRAVDVALRDYVDGDGRLVGREALQNVAVANFRRSQGGGLDRIFDEQVLSTALSGDATLVDAWDFMMRDGAPPLVKVIVSPDPAPGPGGVPHAHGGQFQFKHQSLQEFFVAEDLRMALVNGETHGAFSRDEPGWTNFLVARAFSQEYFKSTSRVHTTVPIGHLSNILAIAADLADVSDLLLGGRGRDPRRKAGRRRAAAPLPHPRRMPHRSSVLDLRGHGSGLKSTLKFVSRCAGLEELRLGGTSVCGTLRHLSGLGR
ncbi:hypothetical protein JL720_10555 [Aureococcus anophagefferens]|nr:hypothetical protein JL720_10555 [Aureococcus anophagefferens]